MRLALVVSVALLTSTLVGCKGDPNTPEYWDKALHDAKAKKERLRLVEEMRNRKLSGPFVPVLHKRLAEDKAPEVKEAVARLLGELKDPSSVDPLINALDMAASESNERAMNKEIVIALGHLGDKKAAPALLKCLKMKDNYTVIAAIEGLGHLRAPEAVQQLLDLATADGSEPFVSKKAIIALGEIGDVKAAPDLMRMMFKERRGVSFYVESSFALYQLGQPAADLLVPVINGQDKELVKWAAEANILEPALYAKAAQVLGDLHDMRAEGSMIEKLGYNNEMLDIKLFVRMRMADGLGRLRSQKGAKAIAAMLEEEEATARAEYGRALSRIGGREAIPQLVKSAGKGPWDAREASIIALGMVGDDREKAAFEKIAKDEEALFTAECKEWDGHKDCKDLAAGVKRHLGVIEAAQKRAMAAGECKEDNACWMKKLDDAETGVRERAAYELGRSGKADVVAELTRRLTEKNLDARLAIIQAIDWLVTDSKDAAKKAQEVLPALQQQIADEKMKTEFVRVNEDLRRLAVKIERGT